MLEAEIAAEEERLLNERYGLPDDLDLDDLVPDRDGDDIEAAELPGEQKLERSHDDLMMEYVERLNDIFDKLDDPDAPFVEAIEIVTGRGEEEGKTT